MPSEKRKVELLPRRRLLLQQALALWGLGALSFRSSAVDRADSPSAIPETARVAILAAWVYSLYPHASLSAAVYDDVARAMAARAAADPATLELLNGGIASLNAASKGDWLSQSPAQRTAILTQQESTPAFGFVRATAAFLLYTRPDVWKTLGYGGDAWSFGGYSREQVNFIDWLPDPKPIP